MPHLSVIKYQTCGSIIKQHKTPHRCYYAPSGARLHYGALKTPSNGSIDTPHF